MLLIASLNVSRPAVEVTSNVAWTASADKDWVSEITPSDGQAADKPATVEIVVAANEEEEPDDEIIPDHRLYVAWTFTTVMEGRADALFMFETQNRNSGENLILCYPASDDIVIENDAITFEIPSAQSGGKMTPVYIGHTLSTGTAYLEPSVTISPYWHTLYLVVTKAGLKIPFRVAPVTLEDGFSVTLTDSDGQVHTFTHDRIVDMKVGDRTIFETTL